MEQVTRKEDREWIIVDAAAARLQRMRRSVLTAARLLAQSSPSGGRWVMVTLTYRPGEKWEAKQITTFLKRLRQWAFRRSTKARYVWVMELTQKGVPHYHCLIFVPRGLTLPKADKRGWWPHGMTRTELARSAVGYVAKYSSKGSYGLFPAGARIHGNGGLEQLRDEHRWWLLPQYVREACAIADRVRRVVGGFLSRETGEFFRGQWAFGGAGPGFVRLVKVT